MQPHLHRSGRWPSAQAANTYNKPALGHYESAREENCTASHHPQHPPSGGTLPFVVPPLGGTIPSRLGGSTEAIPVAVGAAELVEAACKQGECQRRGNSE